MLFFMVLCRLRNLYSYIKEKGSPQPLQPSSKYAFHDLKKNLNIEISFRKTYQFLLTLPFSKHQVKPFYLILYLTFSDLYIQIYLLLYHKVKSSKATCPKNFVYASYPLTHTHLFLLPNRFFLVLQFLLKTKLYSFSSQFMILKGNK